MTPRTDALLADLRAARDEWKQAVNAAWSANSGGQATVISKRYRLHAQPTAADYRAATAALLAAVAQVQP